MDKLNPKYYRLEKTLRIGKAVVNIYHNLEEEGEGFDVAEIIDADNENEAIYLKSKDHESYCSEIQIKTVEELNNTKFGFYDFKR